MPWKDKKEAKRKLKIWRGKNRFRISLYSRKFKYGLNANEFNLLVESRNNKCEICGVFLKESKEIHIDHDHTTKMVRGLLCGNCNRGLGIFGEKIKNLEAAISYLMRVKVLPRELVNYQINSLVLKLY